MWLRTPVCRMSGRHRPPTERVGAGSRDAVATTTREATMPAMTLGIDVAVRARHRATLADERGAYVWSGVGCRTHPGELERLWARVPADAQVTVVLAPTRNAWVPLAAWCQARRRDGGAGAARAVQGPA